MKRSELKEAIKAEIKSVLSEEITEAKFIKFKGDSDDNKMEVEAEREMNTPDGELKVYTVKTDDGVQSYTADQVEVVNEIAPMGPGQTTTLADFEDEEDNLVRVSQKAVRIQLDQYENGMIDGDELANGIEQIVFGDIAPRGMMKEAEYTDRVGKSRLASNKYKQADEFNKSYDSVAQAAAEKQFDDDVMDKAASKKAKKEKIGKQASKLSQADEDRYERIKNGLEKLKKKGDEESIKRMKAILGKKDVQKLIKAKGREESSFM